MSGKLYPNTTQVPNIFLDKVMCELPAAPLKVLLAIARFTYGFQKQSDKIGNKQLTKATGLSRSSVIRGVQLLGDLITVRQGGPSKGANEYSLNLDVSDAMVQSLKRRIIVSGSSASDTSSAHDTSVSHATEVIAPVSPFQTNSSKPNKERINQRRKKDRSDPASLKAFEEFYRAYPKHVDKTAAQKAWVKLAPSPDLIAEIMAGVKRYCDSVLDVEFNFIKQPGPWLNARRWEDELTAKAAPKSATNQRALQEIPVP